MVSDSDTTIQFFKDRIAKFVKERDWEKYHHPKEVAISISIEAAELLELFQWIEKEHIVKIKKNEKAMKEIKEELADIMDYCLALANQLDIDVSQALYDKIRKNEEKYPVEKIRGNYKKYTELK